jgi:homoserine kinase
VATAYRVDAKLVLAKDKHGRTHHYYSAESGAGPSIIEWLSDEQAAHFLAENLVTAIEIQTETETETQATLDRVSECVEALATADLPTDCGAPTARDALRDAGHKFSNQTIAAAIRIRRGVSGTHASTSPK